MATASTDFRHETPDELRILLDANESLNAKWNDLTSLARNEWICWLTSPKKQETRTTHLVRLQEDILGGKRRPCCWPGCPHRRDSARKWFKD
ncbi:MAG: YdeI/OmpD-associated family protein [Sphingomicrobium sp.]